MKEAFTEQLLATSVFWLRKVWDRTGEMFREVGRGFPNLFSMADAIIRYSTGLAGLFVEFPIDFMETLLQRYLRAEKMHYRLIRVDDSVHVMFEAQRFLLRQTTFTSEDSILELMTRQLCFMVYRHAGRLKLLRRMIKAKSEVELADAVINSLKGKARLFGIAALVWIALLGQVFFCLFWWNIAFGYNMILNNPLKNGALPQDSAFIKTIYKRRTVRRHRFNARTGPDVRTP